MNPFSFKLMIMKSYERFFFINENSDYLSCSEHNNSL